MVQNESELTCCMFFITTAKRQRGCFVGKIPRTRLYRRVGDARRESAASIFLCMRADLIGNQG